MALKDKDKIVSQIRELSNKSVNYELPYKSYPIDWTAPERLALASLLMGGPYPPLNEYRVLELGCGKWGEPIEAGILSEVWDLYRR